MSEVRKKQKQNLPNKGKALSVGPRAGSHLAPALWRVAAERRIRVRCLSLDTGRCRHTRNDKGVKMTRL